MEYLKNKTYATFDYTCRYTNVPYYYHIEDDKYIFGIGSNLNKNTTYVAHKVRDFDTLDSLSLKYYGNPTFYWVIANYNDIQDAYITLSDYFDIIKIPAFNSITFGAER